MSTWGHSIVPAEPGRRCVRNRCGQPAAWQARYRSRSKTTGLATFNQIHLCGRHGATWSARHGLTLPPLPTEQEAPAVSAAGATPSKELE